MIRSTSRAYWTDAAGEDVKRVVGCGGGEERVVCEELAEARRRVWEGFGYEGEGGGEWEGEDEEENIDETPLSGENQGFGRG